MLTEIREWGLLPEIGTVIVAAVVFVAVVAILALLLDMFEKEEGPPPAILDQIDTAARWLDGRRKHWSRLR